MPMYYVTAYGGRCGLMMARNLEHARSKALREVGTNNFQSVEKATEQQIAWVEAMGGRVPKEGD